MIVSFRQTLLQLADELGDRDLFKLFSRPSESFRATFRRSCAISSRVRSALPDPGRSVCGKELARDLAQIAQMRLRRDSFLPIRPRRYPPESALSSNRKRSPSR